MGKAQEREVEFLCLTGGEVEANWLPSFPGWLAAELGLEMLFSGSQAPNPLSFYPS